MLSVAWGDPYCLFSVLFCVLVEGFFVRKCSKAEFEMCVLIVRVLKKMSSFFRVKYNNSRNSLSVSPFVRTPGK